MVWEWWIDPHTSEYVSLCKSFRLVVKGSSFSDLENNVKKRIVSFASLISEDPVTWCGFLSQYDVTVLNDDD